MNNIFTDIYQKTGTIRMFNRFINKQTMDDPDSTEFKSVLMENWTKEELIDFVLELMDELDELWNEHYNLQETFLRRERL